MVYYPDMQHEIIHPIVLNTATISCCHTCDVSQKHVLQRGGVGTEHQRLTVQQKWDELYRVAS